MTVKKLFLVGLLLGFSSQAWGASFNCIKSIEWIEKVICHDPELSSLDDNLAKSYREALSRSEDPKALKAAERSWIKYVRNGCMTQDCLKEIYRSRIKKLQSIGTEGSETKEGTSK